MVMRYAKMSDRLIARLAESPGGPPLHLNILLRSDLEAQQVASMMTLLGANAESGHRPQLLSRSKMVHVVMPVANARSLADLDEVFWVDTDTEAPVEALLDEGDTVTR